MTPDINTQQLAVQPGASTDAPAETPAVPMGTTQILVDGQLVTLTADQQAVHDAEVATRVAELSQIAGPRRIIPFAFRSRFTSAEKIAIEIACMDDPAAQKYQRAMAASLRVAQADIATAPFISLDSPETAARVQALEHAGLLALGRAAEILGAEVQAHEAYRGPL
jgi:hypothetical protein